MALPRHGLNHEENTRWMALGQGLRVGIDGSGDPVIAWKGALERLICSSS